jgi:hypothetical protein
VVTGRGASARRGSSQTGGRSTQAAWREQLACGHASHETCIALYTSVASFTAVPS